MPRQLRIDAVFKAVDRVTAPIGRMQVRIRRFTRSMRRGLRAVDRVTSRVARGLATGFKRGAFIAAGAIAALGLAMNKLADDTDQLAKRSRQLNFPIEELQEWRFVAEQSGLETASFDKAIAKFAKNVGEARGGYGALITSLKKTDRSFLKQIKRTDNVAEAFDLYIKKMRETPNAMDKAALAVAAFGRAGIDLITIADTSVEAIEALRKEQIENGVVTMEQAQATEAYNDSLNSLKRSLGGFLQTVLIPLMPMLTDAARATREWVVANREMISERVLKFVQDIIDNFDSIVEKIKEIAKGVAVFFAFAGAVKVLIGVMELLNIVMAMNVVGAIVAGVILLAAAVAAAWVHADKLKKIFDEIPAPLKLIGIATAVMFAPFLLFIAAAVAIKLNLERIKSVSKSVWDTVSSGARTASTVVGDAWEGVVSTFVNVWNTVVDTVEGAVNYLVQTGPISWLIAAVILIKDNWSVIKGFFGELWAAVTGIFTGHIDNIKSGASDFADAVSPIIDAWLSAQSFFADMWSTIGSAFSTAINWIVNTGPVKWFIDSQAKLLKAWSPVIEFFKILWDKVIVIFKSAVSKISNIISPIIEAFKKLSQMKDKLIETRVGDIDLGAAKITREVEDQTNKIVEVDFKSRKKLPKTPDEFVGSMFGMTMRQDEDHQEQEDVSTGRFKPRLVDTQAAALRSFEERMLTEKTVVTIKDETERAEITKGNESGRVKLEQKRTGTF